MALKPLRLLSRMSEKAVVQRVVVDDSSSSGIVLLFRFMVDWSCSWLKRFGGLRLSEINVGSIGKVKRSRGMFVSKLRSDRDGQASSRVVLCIM